MKALPSVIAFVILVPLVAFTQGDKGRYITKSHLNKVPPEIANGATTRVNAKEGLTLRSLRGSLVLLLFTSTA